MNEIWDPGLRAQMTTWAGRYQNILVTGPQRSGTRIGAKIIARETGFSYVDEVAFDAHDRQKFRNLARDGEHVVIQCPTMMRWVHEDGTGKHELRPNLVVVMVRDLLDIYRSEKRIEWEWEGHEMAKYCLGRPRLLDNDGEVKEPTLLPSEAQPKDGHRHFKTTNDPAPRSAEVKYHFFETVQKRAIDAGNADWTQLRYEQLAGHPLWVPKAERKDFAWDQTERKESA